MPNVIQIRRSSSATSYPALAPGELAHSEALLAQIAVGTSGNADVILGISEAERAKLAAIEAAATADQTGAEIVSLIEAEADANLLTDDELTKLQGIEGSKFLGSFASLGALQTAHPAPSAGSYGDVDPGAGTDVQRYIWDVDDAQYIAGSGGGGETAASIKSKYESNANTNAFTDAEQTKLAGIETAATADQTGAEIVSLIGTEPDVNLVSNAQLQKIDDAAVNFLQLDDTPGSFSADALVFVNAAGNALEFRSSIDGGTF